MCIVFGFWQASRARQCSMGRRTLNFGLLAISTVMTAGAVFFPQAIANRLTPSAAASGGAVQQSITLTSADQFRQAFNAAPDDAIKVVGFYSPT